MALVLLVIAGLATAYILFNALGSVAKRLDATASNAAAFQKIHQALAQFVMLNQRLPCPASGTANTGDADPNAAATACNTPAGVVPWNTLGLSKTDAVDPWGRYFFYRVYDGASGFTRSNGMMLHDCVDDLTTTTIALTGTGASCNPNSHENSISDFFASKGLTVNDMGTTKSTVAYVLISPGETGFSGYYPGGSTPLSAPSSSSKEFLNAGSAGTYWITAPSAPDVAADDAAHFDDVVSYAMAVDVAKNARLAGRPWKLYQIFSQSALGLAGSNYNSGSTAMKVRPASAGLNQGPVTVTASGALLTRNVCASDTTVQGLTSCFTFINTGSDMLDNSLGTESLEFDFRMTRNKLVIALTDFKMTGGGSNREQAQLTFYNGATQVDQKTAQACDTGHPVGQFTVTPASPFTKVTVTPVNATGGGASSFAVAAMLACKLDSDCPSGSAPPSIGWPAVDCFGSAI